MSELKLRLPKDAGTIYRAPTKAEEKERWRAIVKDLV